MPPVKNQSNDCPVCTTNPCSYAHGCSRGALWPRAIAAFILGVSLIGAAAVAGNAYLAGKRADDAVTVTGSSKRNVKSDTAKWVAQITRPTTGGNLKGASELIKKDMDAVVAYFKAQGIDQKDLTISPVYNDPVYKQNYDGVQDYTLRQTVTYQATDVDKVTNMAKDVSQIQSQGVPFATLSLEYYYSKLADLRVDMLSEAIQDAKNRADQIATSGGVELGSLKTASSGVVQVLAPNSLEISDYGAYDTSTIDKQVISTVRATFSLE